MSLRLFLVGVGLAVSACALYDDSDFPESATPLAPPAEFRAWWAVVESCSGRQSRFEDVRWFQASYFSIRGELALGAWFPAGNRIALLGSESFPASIVRHEMLHAILQDSDHPAEYFQSRCGDIVECGRDCPTEAIPPEVTPTSFDGVEVSLEVFPSVPSLSRHDGHVTFVVTVRNTANRNVYLQKRDYALAQCPVGVLVSSVADPDRTVLRCAWIGFGGLPRFYLAGESRRVVVDVDLQNLNPGEGPFAAEPVIAGAVLNDNVRRTLAVTIRP